jgi:hypothetical protein
MGMDLKKLMQRKGINQSVNEQNLENYVKSWYRKHGQDCEFSVWRVIKLVRVYVELEGTENKEFLEESAMLAPLVLADWINRLEKLEDR